MIGIKMFFQISAIRKTTTNKQKINKNRPNVWQVRNLRGDIFPPLLGKIRYGNRRGPQMQPCISVQGQKLGRGREIGTTIAKKKDRDQSPAPWCGEPPPPDPHGTDEATPPCSGLVVSLNLKLLRIWLQVNLERGEREKSNEQLTGGKEQEILFWKPFSSKLQGTKQK